MSEWQPIETAKKNRTEILAKFFDDLYPRLYPKRPDLARWNGQRVVIRHDGLADDGFDIGWSMAAPVGHGGFPDDWIEGWMPLPAPPSHSKGPLTMDDPGYRFTLRSWHVWNGR